VGAQSVVLVLVMTERRGAGAGAEARMVVRVVARVVARVVVAGEEAAVEAAAGAAVTVIVALGAGRVVVTAAGVAARAKPNSICLGSATTAAERVVP
jgi:hypothetical protein